jgi:hypothetical protein
MTAEDLHAIVNGATQPALSSAADYVQTVLSGRSNPQSKRAKAAARKATPRAAKPLPNKAPSRSSWDRHLITEDIELHVRRPLSRDEDRRVRRLLEHASTLFDQDPS